MDCSRRDDFWSGFPGLVWSNSRASDSVMIRAALLRPRFHELLRICLEFSIPRVEKEFELIRGEYRTPASAALVAGILDNIRKGFQRASAEHRENMADSPIPA
jgi:hypothetical protein